MKKVFNLCLCFFLAILLSACGGGGGGSTSGTGTAPGTDPTALFLKDVAPTSINLKTSIGSRFPDLTLTGSLGGDLTQLNGKTLYVLVVTPDTLFDPHPTITVTNAATGSATISLRGVVVPSIQKTYSGDMVVKVCLDSACKTEVGNSSYHIPYTITVGPVIPVTVSVDQLVYRKTSTLTITGKDLDLGLKVYNFGCLGMTEVGTPTSTQRKFSCKMIAVGTVALNIDNSDNTRIYSGTLTIPAPAAPQVVMSTNMGNITLELNPAKAPISVDNFLNYVESKFYANTIFHRVINNFVIQGGGYNASLSLLQTQTPIVLESGNGLSNLRGTLAMARTSASNSATSQFFINVVDNPTLDAAPSQAGINGYAVFGKVIGGMDVVDRIKAVPTTTAGSMTDVPTVPVVINSVTQIQ